VFIAHGSGSRATPGSNYPYFERIRARTDVFTGATAYLRRAFKITTSDGVERIEGQLVSGNYHGLLGVPMLLGRGFTSESDRGGSGEFPAVISEGYWTRRFARDPGVLGRELVVDGQHATIVGVTGRGFSGLDPGTRPDITLPLAVATIGQPDFLTDQGTWLGDMPIVGRLQAGIPRAQATAVVDTVFQTYLSEPRNAWLFNGPGRGDIHASLLPAARGTAGLRNQYSGSIQVLMAMVVVMLLIACANVAGLLLARGTARAREVAVRMSIGADRLRLIRQFLTESALLAVIGGALGFALSRAGVGLIATLVGAGPNPILLNLQPNATVLSFTIVLSVLTGILFGAAPAFGCTRVDVAPVLKAAGTTPRYQGRRWSARQILASVQIALCVLLVSGAGLLARTLRNLDSQDAGFNRDRLLLFTLDASGTSFDAGQLPALCDGLIDRLTSRPDSLSASCSRNIPVSLRGNARPLEVPGAPPQPPNERFVFTNMVTPRYFQTFGIGVVTGRAFDSRDSATAPSVAVINRATARFFFGDSDPIGRRVHFFQGESRPITIVGVVDDTLQRGLRERPPRIVYTPLGQLDGPEPILTVAVRTRQNPLALAASVRSEVHALSREVVVDDVRTMNQQVDGMLVRERLVAVLSTGFGLLALVLSCLGLYGVVSYDVARGVRDVGIRMALGARRGDVVRQVIGKALSFSSIGVLAGIVAAVAGTRLLSSLLFGITARDPVTLASTAALLLMTTLLASYVPARRASRIDPAVVLRME
jgi:predicted permease